MKRPYEMTPGEIEAEVAAAAARGDMRRSQDMAGYLALHHRLREGWRKWRGLSPPQGESHGS